MKWKFQIRFSFYLFSLAFSFQARSQCTGLNVDAGPDLVSCDSSQSLQLQGSIQGTYTKFYWTPATGLSNANILDPFVTRKTSGRYTYKLTAEGISSTNLVVNGDFENGNSGFISNYTYTNVNTTEGEYFVASNPATWNGGFSPCPDHTTGSGNMLLLNGHPTAGTNFWCQTIATVPGRMYQFEFWSQSVYPTNIAQLSVKVNGSTIGSTQAGSLCNWVLYTVSFTATSASTQICLNETTGIRGGNDFAVDDIALYEKCIAMDDVTVEIVNLVAKIDIINKPKCSSDPFDLTAIGSSAGPNIRYEWSTDVGKILSKNGLSAKARGSGIYTVKVIYSNGNVLCEQEASIEFIAPDQLAGALDASGKANCRGDSVRLFADVLTGSGQYSFKWSPDSLILKGKNTNEVLVNKAQRFSVTITDQTNGCSLSLEYDVPADTIRPIAGIRGDTLIDCRNTNIELFSLVSDSINYALRWVTPRKDSLSDLTHIIDSLDGNYQLFIEDRRNHCRDSSTIQVKIDTAKPVVALGPDVQLDCRRQITFVTSLIKDTVSKLNYYWTIDAKLQPREDSLSGKSISKASSISLLVVNATNGCQALDSIEITEDRRIPDLDAGPGQLLTCTSTTALLKATVNPLDTVLLDWTSPDGHFLTAQNKQDTWIDKKGWYYVHIINTSNGCENADSVYVDENVVKPKADAGSDLVFRCKDSLVLINASQSSSGSNIIYSWSSVNGNIQSGSSTNQIWVSTPGTYTLIVKDTLNGCVDSASVTVTPDLNKPFISLSLPDTLTCLKTEIKLSANASSPSGASLSGQWTDANGNPLTFPDSLQLKIRNPGTYIFTATDKNNGCSSSAQVSISIDTIRPIIDAGKDEVWNCASTLVALSALASGHASSLNYTWSTQNGTIIGSSNRSGINIRGPGDYICTVVDPSNGCSSSDQLSVIPDLLKPTIQIQKPDTLNCYKTEIVINAQGSSNGNRFVVLWSSINGNIIGPLNQTIVRIDRPGKYTLEIMDTINHCNAMDSVEVIEDRQFPDVGIQQALEITCSRKSVDLNASVHNAGTNYNIIWSTTNGNIISPPNILNILVDKAGTYFIRVKNQNNGCENSDSINVRENLNIPTGFDYTIQQPKCKGDVGFILIDSVTGGEKPYRYFIDNVPVNGTAFNNLSPGQKTIKIVDANGCSFTREIIIDQPSSVGVQLPSYIKIDLGQSYQLKPSFLSPADSIAWIQWSPAEFLSCSDCAEPFIQNLKEPTSFTVTYANNRGCIATASIRVELIKRDIWVPNVFSPNGDNINDWFYPFVAEGSYRNIRSISIFDRWGDLLFYKEHFQPNNPLEGWDGTNKGEKLNPAVFLYILEVEWNDGSVQKLYGDISLIR